METTALQFRLTDDERQHFNTQGYLIVEDVLDREQVARLTVLTDAIHEKEAGRGL